MVSWCGARWPSGGAVPSVECLVSGSESPYPVAAAAAPQAPSIERILGPKCLDQRGTTVISDRVRDLLIEQVGHELSAHQAYYGISLYF